MRGPDGTPIDSGLSHGPQLSQVDPEPVSQPGLGAVSDPAGAFGLLAGLAVVIAAWTAGYGLRRGWAGRVPDRPVLRQAGRTGTRT